MTWISWLVVLALVVWIGWKVENNIDKVTEAVKQWIVKMCVEKITEAIEQLGKDLHEDIKELIETVERIEK